MRKIAKKVSPAMLVVASLVIAAIAVYASDSATVPYTTTQQITGPDGICKKVTNNSGTGLSEYVPTVSVAEWQSFVANPPAGVTLAACVASCTAGSQNYTTPGTYTFTVPVGTSGCSFTVQVWGGGGGGGGNPFVVNYNGSSGGDSSLNGGVVAGGGGGTQWTGSVSQGGAGGIASGGSTNTNGNPGGSCPAANLQTAGCQVGGSSPNGGAGATVVGASGQTPGGGGAGGTSGGGGGGGGAYSSNSYGPGVVPTGTSVTVVVGAGGAGGSSAGAGAPGAVYISWN